MKSSKSIADELAPYTSVLSPHAFIELTEKVECIVAAAEEAKLSDTAREHRYQHTRIHAAELLDISVSHLADLIKAGVIKLRREGGRCMVLDSEVQRFLKTDS